MDTAFPKPQCSMQEEEDPIKILRLCSLENTAYQAETCVFYAGDPFAMLEGLQNPQEVPRQPTAAKNRAGGIDLEALYGEAPSAAVTPPVHASDDPFGLGGLSAPSNTNTVPYSGGLSSWSAGAF